MALKLSVIIASTRPGRGGPSVAKWVEEEARKHEAFDVNVLDLQDFDLPLLDEPHHPMQQKYTKDHTKRWSEAVAPANAYIFVTPEYDYFPPAGLVNALQCLSLEWRYKVAGVVSYGGISGGLRATQELRLLLCNLGVMPIPQSVPIPFYKNHMGESGAFAPAEQVSEGLRVALKEIERWASALKSIRRD